MNSPLASSIPSARTADTRAFVRTSTPMLGQDLERGGRDPLRQRGQNSARSFDQNDADVPVRIDLIEAIGHHLARALIELGGELGAGRARADDGDMQLAGLDRLALRLRAQAGVDQAMVKSHRLFRGLQRNGELRRAGVPKSLVTLPMAIDQRIVGNGARRRDLAPLLVMGRAEPHHLRRPVETDHLAEVIAKMVPMRLGEIVELVLGRVHAAGRHRMQQRLPQMRAAALDQRDIGQSAFAQPVAKTGDKLETRRSAANDDDPVQMMVAGRPRHEIQKLLLAGPYIQEASQFSPNFAYFVGAMR